ncbi:MAG: helix-turn-helix transcriptional regulator [Bacteriovoracaceae bacterium]|nr:helix-turn-helix transcriptional regulator [Bacteriovoracaceae bacterium]
MRHFGHIAQLIKSSRLSHPKKFSQTELSTELGYKNGQFISNIERGLCSVPVKSLSLLTRTLDIDPITLKDALLKDMEKTLDNYLSSEEVSVINNSINSSNFAG